MCGLAGNGTAEPIHETKILAGTGTAGFFFPRLANHKQDWQPYPVGAHSTESDNHTHANESVNAKGIFVYH